MKINNMSLLNRKKELSKAIDDFRQGEYNQEITKIYEQQLQEVNKEIQQENEKRKAYKKAIKQLNDLATQ